MSTRQGKTLGIAPGGNKPVAAPGKPVEVAGPAMKPLLPTLALHESQH